MRLKEIDWNRKGGAGYVLVEYPNEIGERFLDWLRTTPAWKENPGLVERKVNQMNRELIESRQKARRAARLVAQAPTASPPPPAKPLTRAEREKALAGLSPEERKARATENRRAALARGRAKQAAKRAAA